MIKALNGLDSRLFCHDTGAIYDWLNFWFIYPLLLHVKIKMSI